MNPTAPEARLPLLDLLRGVAIVGIVFANAQFYATPRMTVPGYRVVDEFPGAVDRVADWLVVALAEGKLYPLLGLLFGYGFGAQLERGGAGARYARRLIALLVLGLLHLLLVWAGDVLVAYALLGAVLALFRRRSDRTLLRWALALGLVHVAWLLVAAVSHYAFPLDELAVQKAAVEATHAYGDGGWEEAQRARTYDAALNAPLGVLVAGPGFLAMFLLGYWAQRRELLRRARECRALLRRTALLGLAVGGGTSVAAATLWQAGGRGAEALATALSAGALVHALGYGAALALLGERARARLLAPLRAVGRTALSNYLFQSLVATTIFYGYGLGLYGEVGPARLLAIAAAVAAAGAALSVAWLRLFRFGPAEWLLRSLTYARPQPLR